MTSLRIKATAASAAAAMAALVLGILAVDGHAHGYKRKGLEIVHPWAPATEVATGTQVSAPVGMLLRNSGKAPDRLLGASSPAATRVEMHDAANAAVAAIAVGGGADVELKPAATHLLLVGLKKGLTEYATVPLTLRFEKAGSITVDVMIEDSQAAPAPHAH